MGCELFPLQPTLSSYVGWAYEATLFEVLDHSGRAKVDDVSAATLLNEAGADSLLGVMCALGLVACSTDEQYCLTPTGRDYCLRASPYLVADQFVAVRTPIPPTYLKAPTSAAMSRRMSLMAAMPAVRFGTIERLYNQHARNLPACAAAVKTGEFATVKCLLDLGGGSGTFSIPFALEYPNARVLLADLPEAMPGAQSILAAHGLADRIELFGFDAFSTPWPVPECDGVFVGNFLHGFDDRKCVAVCRAIHDRLAPGGTVWLHELLWNSRRDGPLLTALLHANMRSAGSGRQRTAAQLCAMLSNAGFIAPSVVPTLGAYALVAARKP
jgi:predicted O-methyltransferase YrrM